MIKKLLGIAPTKEENGIGYIPSPVDRKFGVDKVSGYRSTDFASKKYSGDKKILVLCTEERYFKTANGKHFSKGNNVQETMVPLMHLNLLHYLYLVDTVLWLGFRKTRMSDN